MKKIIGLLSIIIITLISCDDDAQINLGNSSLPENQPNFQVEFDGQTYKADYVEASIVDGVTILKATKTPTNEMVVIALNRDEIGAYTLTPNGDVATIGYKKEIEETFYTSPTAYAGRVDLTEITSDKLFGEFAFIGTRSVPLLDDQGQPVLDNGNIVYTEEIKNFTNGVFSNISYSLSTTVDANLEPEPTPENNTFFVKKDGTEFIEAVLSAEKMMVDGAEVIKIQAITSDSNRRVILQIPLNIEVGSPQVLHGTTTSPMTEAVATYLVQSPASTYKAYSGAIAEPKLTISSHDLAAKVIVGTFEFSSQNAATPPEIIEFTEGAFTIVYTE